MISYVINALYVVVAIGVWPLFARKVLAQVWGPGPYASQDYMMAGIASLIRAVLWPLAFAFVGIGWLIAHPLRDYLFGRAQ